MTMIAVGNERSILRISGSDALSFLDGQVSQSVAQLIDGEGSASLLLQPDGKMVDLVGLHRQGDEVLVDVATGALDLVEQRLRRFLFRVKVTIERTDLVVCWWPEGGPVGNTLSKRRYGARGVLSVHDEVPHGVQWLHELESATFRIDQEIPAFGSEITEGTIPASLGAGLVAASVSFTKGCYTGQELVARLDARGSQVPFHLVALRSVEPFVVGEELRAEVDGPAGVVTSVAPSIDGAATIGLGFVHRSQVECGTFVSSSGRSITARRLDGALIFGP